MLRSKQNNSNNHADFTLSKQQKSENMPTLNEYHHHHGSDTVVPKHTASFDV